MSLTIHGNRTVGRLADSLSSQWFHALDEGFSPRLGGLYFATGFLRGFSGVWWQGDDPLTALFLLSTTLSHDTPFSCFFGVLAGSIF